MQSGRSHVHRSRARQARTRLAAVLRVAGLLAASGAGSNALDRMPKLGQAGIMLRLQRWGAKHKPAFRLVACQRTAPRNGNELSDISSDDD